MKQYEVEFEPDGIKTTVRSGVTIMEAANRVGIILDAVCGGAGTCNKCLVEIDGGPGQHRACQTNVDRNMIVTIPDSSRFFEQKILQEGIALQAKLEPLVCKHYVQLCPPSLADLRSEANRLIEAVNDQVRAATTRCHDHAGAASSGTTLAAAVLRQLPALFRNNNYSVTAVCHRGRIFTIEPRDTTPALFGVAADIGTTSVVVSLVNLSDGKTVGIASETNPQVAFGDDVISRIDYSRTQPDGLNVLQHRIVDCLNRLIGRICQQSLVSPWQIYELTAAGNATMQHLLLAVPVEQIAQAPYVSVFSAGVNVPAASLGIDIHPDGNVYVMPSIAAHIGGDTVAVALATAMKHSATINLAVDIGTNGEVVLGNQDKLLVCSTAAGPAFEGARIQFGMRGAKGAIERVFIADDVEISVIGGVKPSGICGSGLIDAIAELLNVGLIDATGRLTAPDDLPSDTPDALRQRLILSDGKPAFVLAPAEHSQQGQDILLTQRDIREAQLGKAAIRAGITMLMRELPVDLDDIDHLYLAGAFGNYIRPASAVRLGLLPPLPPDKIQFVGNAAGAGAREVLLSAEARRHAEQLGAEATYVELAGRPDFQDIFSDEMLFAQL